MDNFVASLLAMTISIPRHNSPAAFESTADDLRRKLSPLNRLQLAIGEPHHFQQQPAVAKARDLGLAEGARLVVDRGLDDFEILLCGAEDQIEIAERIEIAEIVALPRQHFVVLPQEHLGAAQ